VAVGAARVPDQAGKRLGERDACLLLGDLAGRGQPAEYVHLALPGPDRVL
jgi:hypothetical protein